MEIVVRAQSSCSIRHFTFNPRGRVSALSHFAMAGGRSSCGVPNVSWSARAEGGQGIVNGRYGADITRTTVEAIDRAGSRGARCGAQTVIVCRGFAEVTRIRRSIYVGVAQIMSKRVNAIERRLRGKEPDLSDPVERVKEDCVRLGAGSVRYRWVMPDYYDTPLEERADYLGCAPEQLCKTMVMENKGFAENTPGHVNTDDPTRNRFYLVVVQYAARLSPQKMSAAMLRLKPAGDRGSRARCNLQVAPEEVGLSLSGFPHNGVSIFGGLTPMPVILSEAVLGLRPAFVWMGAGHPSLKLGVSASDLEERLGVIVADISVPRDGSGVDNGIDV